MEVIKVSRYRIGKRALARAITTLREGGVVAFPTETAYGLAADPTDTKAVRRIYRMTISYRNHLIFSIKTILQGIRDSKKPPGNRR